MIDIRAAVRSWLLADAGIAAIVATRAYPGELPQGVRSTSLVYNTISEQGDYHMSGPSGLALCRMQIDAWAQTPDDAAVLANLVKERMDDLRQTTLSYGSASPQEQATIQSAFLDTGRMDYDAQADMRRVSRDYIIWYEE